MNNSDVLKNNIKSRKALQNSINDKRVPSAIKRLQITTTVVLIALIALSSTEFSIVTSQFK